MGLAARRPGDDRLGCLASVGVAAGAVALFVLWIIVFGWLATALRVHPVAPYLLVLPTAGAVAGLFVGYWPRRWVWVVAPLMFIIIVAGPVAIMAMWLATGDYAAPQGTFSGALLAIALGLVAVRLGAMVRSKGRSLPAAMGVLALAVLVGVGTSVLHARHQLARVRTDILPAVEDLVARDVLVETGPVDWEPPRYLSWSSGVPFIFTSGHMSGSRVVLRFAYDTPRRTRGAAGSAEGLQADGLQIDLPQPRDLNDSEAKDPRVVRALLRSMGVRPELADRLAGGSATYRGVTYTFGFNHWRAFDFTEVRCKGVRSTSRSQAEGPRDAEHRDGL